jgi:plastocyanin
MPVSKLARTPAIWISTVLAGLVLATPNAAGQALRPGKTYVVTMTNMSFGGLPAQAKAGDTIIWHNNDTVQHSATARDGSFDYRLQPGQKARTRLNKKGVLRIDCIYHPTMRSTLKVT